MKTARIFALLLALGFAASCNVRASEEILDFASKVAISRDGWLTVTETITVQAEGNEIKRGIYRDFPTLYNGPWGLRSSVPFKVMGVLRDGKPEAWHTEKRNNGIRIYFGREDVFLQPGRYTYTLTYRTGRQLGYFAGHDELYWNVTGNGWAFPIERASVCVELPPGAHPSDISAYTGASGAKGANFRIASRPGCDAFVETTARLISGEGFTVAVSWPKGYVDVPTERQRLIELLSANRGLLAGLGGLLLVTIYFLSAWFLEGRDPERGTIIPLYAPPPGLAPQDVRFVDGMGTFDNRSFAAAVLHLAVSRALSIKVSGKKTYTLEKGDPSGLGSDERPFFDKLFSSRSLELKPANHAVVQAARKALAASVKSKNRATFRRNTGLWVAGLVLTLAPLGLSLLDAKNLGAAVFMLIWLSFWSVGCAALAMGVVSAWKKNIWSALPMALFSIPFFGGWAFGAFMLVTSASIWVCAVFFVGLALCLLFHRLLKQPTPEGQKIRDDILGFKSYLSVGEAERLNLENPPERTPALFESFLPYALALGVEQQWSEQFSDVLEAASYDPDWYSGTNRALAATALASSLGGSLSNAISSASTAPGSSSGSSGGGSSGGGGGGGGGGGW